MSVGIHAGKRQIHDLTHTHFIDTAHVEHFQPLLVHKALLAGVDTADAHLPDRIRADSRCHTAELNQLAGTESAQAGQWHAMQIAARGQVAGVEIGMRIQPQHSQVPARLATMTCHSADGADSEAVITAQQHRQMSQPQIPIYGLVDITIPFVHFRQMPVAGNGRQ